MSEEELSRIKSATPNGEFTEESKAKIDAKLEATEHVFDEEIERLQSMRKFTADDLTSLRIF